MKNEIKAEDKKELIIYAGEVYVIIRRTADSLTLQSRNGNKYTVNCPIDSRYLTPIEGK